MMDISVVGTLKKNRNEIDQWYNLIVRQYGRNYYVNIHFDKNVKPPMADHKIHVRARGCFYKDKKTLATKITLVDAIVVEDLGIDEIEVLANYKEEISTLAKEQKFEAYNVDSTEGSDLAW